MSEKKKNFVKNEAKEADRSTRRGNFMDPLEECGLRNLNLDGGSIPRAQMVENLKIMESRKWVGEMNGSERANELERVEPGKSLLHPVVP